MDDSTLEFWQESESRAIRIFRIPLSVNPKFDLHQLRTFVAVADAGGLTHAAERIHLSQPAASAHIKSLERVLGVALFARRANGLALTRHGAMLLPEAQRILAAAAEFSAHAQCLQGQVTGRLRLGAIFDPVLLRLGALMSRMIARHPMIEIEIHHGSSLSLIAGVRSGAIDAGFVLGARPLLGVAALPLKSLEYRIVAPAAWKKKLAGARWVEIARLPWISAPRDGSHYQMASELFARHRFKPFKVIEADSETAISSLVAAGVGLGLMRADLAAAAAEEQKIFVHPAGRARTLLRFIVPEGREAEPALRATLDVVRELWRSRGKRAAHQD